MLELAETYRGTLSIWMMDFSELQVLLFQMILIELLAWIYDTIWDLHDPSSFQNGECKSALS